MEDSKQEYSEIYSITSEVKFIRIKLAFGKAEQIIWAAAE